MLKIYLTLSVVIEVVEPGCTDFDCKVLQALHAKTTDNTAIAIFPCSSESTNRYQRFAGTVASCVHPSLKQL